MKLVFPLNLTKGLDWVGICRWIFIIAGAPILLGCVDTRVSMIDKSLRFEPTSNVGILHQNPSRPFLTIATIESLGTLGATHAEVLEGLKEKARMLGAHAIIINPIHESQDAQDHDYNPWMEDYYKIMSEKHRKMSAVAIRFSGQRAGGEFSGFGERPVFYGQSRAKPGITAKPGFTEKSGYSIDQAVNALSRGDKQQALRRLKPLAENGNSRAQSLLGELFSSGGDIPRDYMAAFDWYRRASAQGEPIAEFGLGILYMQGVGSTRNSQTANRWFVRAIPKLERSADAGYSEPQFHLAVALANGFGRKYNAEESLALLIKSAGGGFYRSQLLLGSKYLENKEIAPIDAFDGDLFSKVQVRKDHPEAAKWFITAAKQGNRHAELIVGDLFFEGIGLTKDAVQAMQWYRKAAASGIARAQARLGLAYLNGEGVPGDPAQGVRFLKSAADQKYAFAQEQMGYLYASGKGVSQSLEAAIDWFYKAGLSYQQNGAKARAISMVDQIEKLRPDENLAKELRIKIGQE